MTSELLSRRDLDFLLLDWLDVPALLERERFAEHSRESISDVLDLAEQIATDFFRPHNKAADAQEPSFDGTSVTLHHGVRPAVEAFAKAGFTSASADAGVGGLQLPATVASACFAWFQAANVSFSAYPFLAMAGANLLLAHGSDEQVATYARPILDGRFLATMALSEPQAGSSLADVATRAHRQDDGSYRLVGNKMWISGAEHDLTENIVHLVLARSGSGEGVHGISLFVVPKVLVRADGSLGERNDVALAGLNHKMGNRATVNTLLNLGEGVHRPGGAAGAVGFLVGQEGRGLHAMFHMMNEARIAVGSAAMALGYTGYLSSLAYARERPQGRAPGAKGESGAASPQVPIIRHADVRRMLLAQKSYVEGALALVLLAGRLVDEERTAATADERARAHLLLDTLTPIVKTWPSQWCLEANSLAMQVMGGYGYTRDHDVEQHYRDNRLNAIHEGTTGIQGLDLLGRKVVAADGAGLAELVARFRETAGRAGARAELAEHAVALQKAADRVVEVTGALASHPDRDLALANSTLYLEALGHVVVSWLWLDQVLALGDRDDDFAEGKRRACAYFFRYELPRTGPQLDLLAATDDTTLTMTEAAF